MVRKIMIFILSQILAAQAFAGLADFTARVRDLGFIANSSDMNIVNSQKAGYATGGSFSMRSPVENPHLTKLQLPHMRAGCNGIDWFGGSFSFINMDEFINTVKAIAQGAAGYAVKLGIETLSPQMANILNELEEVQRMINSTNINSCQMAASLVAGFAPKSQASTNLACQARNMGSNFATDAFTAKYECGKDAPNEGDKEERKEQSGMKDVLDEEFNLVYDALKKTGIEDEETIKLMMSITGTVTASKSGGAESKLDFHKSLMLGAVKTTANESTQSILDGLMKGGGVRIYKCSDSNSAKCVIVTEEKQNIESGLFKKVSGVIGKMATAIRQSSKGDMGALDGFSEEGVKLISMSSVPVLDLLISDLAKGSDVTMGFVEVITLDIALKYTGEIIDEVRAKVLALEKVNQHEGIFKSFQENLNSVEAKLRSEKLLTAHKLQSITGLINFANSESEAMYNNIAGGSGV